MNREILFKAKRKSWKELPKEEWWVEGYLFDDGMPEPKHYFIGGIIVKPYEGTACDKWNVVGIDFCEIDINTLCQYTGLTDKNGKKIWENDILRIGENAKLMVSWHHFKASWVLSKKGWMYNHFFGESVEPEDVEAVGNIFDNADLLEVE